MIHSLTESLTHLLAQGSYLQLNILAAADLDAALDEGGRIIFKFAFLVGCILIMWGGWMAKDGNPPGALSAIIGGLVIALAAVIMTALFGAAGMSGSVIKLSYFITAGGFLC